MKHGTDTAELDALLRRAAVIVRHHRYHRQPLDAAEVAERVLRGSRRRAAHRGVVAEAVAALIYHLR